MWCGCGTPFLSFISSGQGSAEGAERIGDFFSKLRRLSNLSLKIRVKTLFLICNHLGESHARTCQKSEKKRSLPQSPLLFLCLNPRVTPHEVPMTMREAMHRHALFL